MDAAALASLAAGRAFPHARDRVVALGHAVREKHSGGASSLLLERSPDGDLVLHYPRSGAPSAWRYPKDPALPHLARADELLRHGRWDPELPPDVTAGVIGQRLMYNPARRAAFLVHRAGGTAPLVLKLLSATDAPASIHALREVAASGLNERVPLPRLVAAAPAAGATLLEYLPGEPITDWTAEVLDEVVGVLVAVHGLGLEGLPAWSAQRDVAKLERLLALLAAADAGAAAALRPVARTLTARLAGLPARTTTIHRDFTRRHVLLVPGARTPRVGVLDWDGVSTGPPEKDLATLVAGLGAAGPELLDRYERRSSTELDRDLVTALVGVQRLTRHCRRLLAGEVAAALPCRSPVAT
jgi:hypothetical protein